MFFSKHDRAACGPLLEIGNCHSDDEGALDGQLHEENVDLRLLSNLTYSQESSEQVSNQEQRKIILDRARNRNVSNN